MSKRNLTSLLGLALTGFFLWLALRNVDLRQVGAALASADYRYALAAASLTLLSYVLRTARWRIILAPSKTVGVGRLFSPLMIGFTANNLLPARSGEVVRAYALGRREGVSVSLSLATVVVERVCDGLTLVFYLALLSLVFPLPGIGRQVQGLGMVVFGAALAAFGAASERALSFAALSHAIQYVLVTGIGLLLMAHQGLSLGDISRRGERRVAAGP